MGSPADQVPYIDKDCGRPRLSVLSGQETAEANRKIREYILYSNGNPSRASKFWGVEKPQFFGDNLYNDESRLGYLRRALAVSSNLDKYAKAWTGPAKTRTIASVQTIQQRKPSSKLFGKSKEDRADYLTLYHNADVKHLLLGRLCFAGDPKIIVVKTFEEYAEEYDEKKERYVHPISEKDRQKGLQSFEYFMFAAGGKGFLNLISEVAIEVLEQSITQPPHIYQDYGGI